MVASSSLQLPLDPCVPISQEASTAFTKEASISLGSLSSLGTIYQQHELYLKLTPKQKAIAAKYVAEYGVVKTIW